MNFEEIALYSGDSKLLDYSFSNGLLKLSLELDELDKMAQIFIPTHSVQGETLADNSLFHNCRIDLVELNKVLNTENGFYVPSRDFGEMMKEVRNGFSLAYGRKPLEIKWSISLVGYSRLLTCIVARLEDITWIFEE